MSISSKYIKLVFLLIIGILTILLFTSHFLGKNQNKEFLEDQTIFNHAVEFLSKGKKIDGGKMLESLANKYDDNYLVVWQNGWGKEMNGESEKAIQEFLKAQELNPVLSRHPIFLMQFGWTLLHGGYHNSAKLYLEESLKYSLNENQKKQVTEWLKIIESNQAS